MGYFFNKIVAFECALIAITVAITALLQLTIGDFPVDIFSFPLNVIIAALWLFVVVYLYRNRSNIAWVESMLSMRATWLSLAIMVAIGIYLGLQREPNATSWPVVVGILFTLTHLLLITLRGWRTPKGIRWRFTLLHAGLILALGAGFWGAPDRVQLRTALTLEQPTDLAYHLDGTATRLDHTLTLHNLTAEYNASGTPAHFEADVYVDNEIVTLRVNHPYNRNLGEKIYLVSVGNNPENTTPYCIVEIVREPWQWFSLAGIMMLLAGAVMLLIRGPRHQANIDKK